MSTLAEIEAAAESLPEAEKQKLILFLARRLRETGAPMPEPRQLTREQIADWIRQDDEDLAKFNG